MSGIWRDRLVAVVAQTRSGDATVGSGYLLEADRVLTAWHCTVDGDTGQPSAKLTVVRALDGAAAECMVAESAPGLDVALLSVDGEVPWGPDLPGGPVAFGRMDRDRSGRVECEAAGFPRWQMSSGRFRDVAEAHGPAYRLEGAESGRGVMRDPTLSGVAADSGHAWAGFSGAAVFHEGLLLGVVIEHDGRQGDTALQFRPAEVIAEADDDAARGLAQALGIDRSERLTAVTARQPVNAGEPALAQRGWSLERDQEGTRHWGPRARGVSNRGEKGWRFRGRTRALTRITSWLGQEVPDPRVLVITGNPGAGKSAVLARVVTTADRSFRTSMPPDDTGIMASLGLVSCAVHASGKTALEVAAEIATAASAHPPAELEGLAPAVRDALAGKASGRFGIVIDALDEAASPGETRAIIDSVVLPLVETVSDRIRMVVGTRRRDDDGNLLRRFGPALNPVDLDTSEYFQDEDLVGYAMACLRQEGSERPDSPYADEAVTRSLAKQIALSADGNFLIAGLVARTHGLYDTKPVGPAQMGPTRSVRAALDRYLERLEGTGGISPRRLLTALAFADAPGLTAELWKLAVEALPPGRVAEPWPVQIHANQLSAFARSAAANFLVETNGGSGPDSPSERSYRLFHQALSEALLAEREETVDRIDDEQALTLALLQTGREAGWDHGPAYLLRSLPAHARRARMVDDLLSDDAYLLHADLRRLLRVADNVSTFAGRSRTQLVRLSPQAIAGSPGTRAAMFSVTEALENLGNTYRDGGWPVPYRARWAVAEPRRCRISINAHQLGVDAMCTVTVNERELLATGSGLDDMVRLWDPSTGEQIRVLEGHQRGANAMCAVAVDGSELLATGSSMGDGTVRLWDPRTGERLIVLEGHRRGINAMCAVTSNGKLLLATCGMDETVRLWDPRTGEQVRLLKRYKQKVFAACAVTVDGHELLATGGEGPGIDLGNGVVRLWDPGSGEQVRCLTGIPSWVRAICPVTVDGRELLATGSDDSAARLWDPGTGEQIRLLEGDHGGINAMCAVAVSGRKALATGSDDGAVQLHDPGTGERIGTLKGVQAWVRAMCPVTVDGRELLAAGGGTETMGAVVGNGDGTVPLWDPLDKESASSGGCEYRVLAVRGVTVDDRGLLATGGDDGMVRLWDERTGEELMTLKGHCRGVHAICTVTVDGRELLATGDGHGLGGADGEVRLWDLRTAEQVGETKGHSGGVYAMCTVTVDGREVLAIGGDDGVRLHNPGTGEQIGTLEGFPGRVRAMCPVTVDGRELLAVGGVAFGHYGAVWLWDPQTGEDLIGVLDNQRCGVSAMCTVTVDDRELLAVGGDDGVVWLQDPLTGTPIRPLEGHEDWVFAVCTVMVAGRELLATGGGDGAVRLWDPHTGTCAIIPAHRQILDITCVADSLAIGLDSGLLTIKLHNAA